MSGRLNGAIAPSERGRKNPRVPFKERLTVKLRGRTEASDKRHYRRVTVRSNDC